MAPGAHLPSEKVLCRVQGLSAKYIPHAPIGISSLFSVSILNTHCYGANDPRPAPVI